MELYYKVKSQSFITLFHRAWCFTNRVSYNISLMPLKKKSKPYSKVIQARKLMMQRNVGHHKPTTSRLQFKRSRAAHSFTAGLPTQRSVY